MSQQTMALGIGAVPNSLGLFWCCGDCVSVTGGRVSLTWHPPDQKRGTCHVCKREYTFASKYGQAELVEALQ